MEMDSVDFPHPPRQGSNGKLYKFFRIIYSILRIIFVLVNNLYCIPTYVVWCCIFHPVYYINPDLYWYYEGVFFDWLLTMVAFWSYSAGYRIVESGDVIDSLKNEETLVLCNHQSTSDVPLLMHCFGSRRELLEKLNWVMDAVFQYTNFGIVSTLHGDFFINAGRNRRDASLKDLEQYLKSKFLPRKRKWLVLFPEGGFLRKRKAASKRYAEKMKLPNLDYVTLPRLGAIQTIIKTLGDSASGSGDNTSRNGSLKYIVDMTIAYANGEPLDLGNIITGYERPSNIRMHYKIYPLSEVPYENPEALQTWLYNLYIEKNNVLGHYYRNGVFDPETRKMDINETIEKNLPISTDLKHATTQTGAGTDVVDEARSVPSLNLVDEDLVRHRGAKLTLNELMPENLSNTNSSETATITYSDDGSEELPDTVGTERDQYNNRTIHLDLLRVLILHGLFLLSTITHATMFYHMYSRVFDL